MRQALRGALPELLCCAFLALPTCLPSVATFSSSGTCPIASQLLLPATPAHPSSVLSGSCHWDTFESLCFVEVMLLSVARHIVTTKLFRLHGMYCTHQRQVLTSLRNCVHFLKFLWLSLPGLCRPCTKVIFQLQFAPLRFRLVQKATSGRVRDKALSRSRQDVRQWNRDVSESRFQIPSTKSRLRGLRSWRQQEGNSKVPRADQDMPCSPAQHGTMPALVSHGHRRDKMPFCAVICNHKLAAAGLGHVSIEHVRTIASRHGC